MDNILDYVRTIYAGYSTNGAFMDALDLDCTEAMEIIDNLISSGLVKRLGRRYTGFVSYSLTENGKKMMEDRYPDLIKLPLPEDYWKILLSLKSGKTMDLSEVADTAGISEVKVNQCLTFLTDQGYVRDLGFWVRKAKITNQGMKILSTK